MFFLSAKKQARGARGFCVRTCSGSLPGMGPLPFRSVWSVETLFRGIGRCSSQQDKKELF